MTAKFPENDLQTHIAFSIFENRGVFALLLGSGLSRAAEIPTGWEITLDLIRRVALAQGAKDQTDWASWYFQSTGEQPSYSALLEKLSGSPDERRAILQRYIEPTEEDRAEGRKVPTTAHYAVADLVARGYIKVIVTTNFDRLIENALRERGIEPTVVASADALKGAEPLAHSSCFVLKLHGDYKDARILNTEAELASYPPSYNALLDRIFDEYGLVVSGWSGEWDEALRSALLRAPNRRYTTYWSTRGSIGSKAWGLIGHRKAKTLAVASADDFFWMLVENLKTLEQTDRKNPRSIELLLASAKRYIANPQYRIQLDALVGDELEHLVARLDTPEFAPHGSEDNDAFKSRIEKYEAAVEPLVVVAGALGRWGDDLESPLILDVIRTLYRHAESVHGGSVMYLNIRAYPAVLLLTAYGLGLTRAERWATLRELFGAKLDGPGRPSQILVDALFLLSWPGGDNRYWNKLFEQPKKVPLSEHLYEFFAERTKRFLGITPDFDMLFERFENLASLAHLEQYTTAELKKQLTDPAPNDFVWMPIGRSCWNRQNREKILAEFEGQDGASYLKAGFAKGDVEFALLFAQNLKRMSERIR